MKFKLLNSENTPLIQQSAIIRGNCMCLVYWVSVCTCSGSLALGMAGAVDRPSRDWPGRRSVSTSVWTRLIHSSVTAEDFSCSISAGLDKYSAVRLIRE